VTKIVGTGSFDEFEKTTAELTSIGGYVAIGEQEATINIKVSGKYFIVKV